MSELSPAAQAAADTFRALCAELVDAWLKGDDIVGAMNRARATLADEPAVPEGREPAAVTEQPSDGELLKLAQQYSVVYLRSDGSACHPFQEGYDMRSGVLNFTRAVLARWGNHVPAPPADVSQLSDGYHTFAELYEHRHSLMLALMRALPRICWFSRRHADGELPFGSDDWFIVGAELPGAPITYHLPAALYSLAQKTGALELPAGLPWDGHSAADVVHRLRGWAIAPAPPADGEVAELAAALRNDAINCTCSTLTSADLRRAAELLQRQAPQPPADGEVVEVVERLRTVVAAYKSCRNTDHIWSLSGNGVNARLTVTLLTRAAELLQRQALVPVSVSERLPGPEVCVPHPRTKRGNWCWGFERCEVSLARPARWRLMHMETVEMEASHWLPAHALPLPEVGE